jgi:trehalose synthase
VRTVVRPGDIVLLHDPQTAGLAGELRRIGARVVWRCHVGRDTPNEHTDAAWSFLRPYVEQAQGLIFSRRAFAQSRVDAGRLWVIPPSLDWFSPKNCDLTDGDVAAALQHAGLVDLGGDGGSLAFTPPRRLDRNSPPPPRSAVRWPPVPRDARAVLQVSRWDRLKDMAGVLRAFTSMTRLPDDAHRCWWVRTPPRSPTTPKEQRSSRSRSIWRAQPAEARRRLHLCSLPMDDVDENAHLVNALQRHAEVVVQNSLVEGFGLTVTEPMVEGQSAGRLESGRYPGPDRPRRERSPARRPLRPGRVRLPRAVGAERSWPCRTAGAHCP